MNWITNFVRPKITFMLGQKRDTPDNLWIKAPHPVRCCSTAIWKRPSSSCPDPHEDRMPAEARLKSDVRRGRVEKSSFSRSAPIR